MIVQTEQDIIDDIVNIWKTKTNLAYLDDENRTYYEAFMALQEPYTRESICSIYGYDPGLTWHCSECTADVPCVVLIGDYKGGNTDQSVPICLDCLRQAVALAEQTP